MSYNPRIITPRINPDENLNRFIHADKLLPKGCWNCQHNILKVPTAHCVKCANIPPHTDPSINGGWEARLP